jgi:hypothetical protein
MSRNNQSIDTDNPELFLNLGLKTMPAYKAPLRDIRFLMNEVFDYASHYKTLSNGENADADTVDMILKAQPTTVKMYFRRLIKVVMKKVVILTMVK